MEFTISQIAEMLNGEVIGNPNVCINQLNRNIIDNEILKYIEFKTEDEFNKFLYAK